MPPQGSFPKFLQNTQAIEVIAFVALPILAFAKWHDPEVYRKTSREYIVARASCNAAKGMASLTKRPNDIAMRLSRV